MSTHVSNFFYEKNRNFFFLNLSRQFALEHPIRTLSPANLQINNFEMVSRDKRFYCRTAFRHWREPAEFISGVKSTGMPRAPTSERRRLTCVPFHSRVERNGYLFIDESRVLDCRREQDRARVQALSAPRAAFRRRVHLRAIAHSRNSVTIVVWFRGSGPTALISLSLENIKHSMAEYRTKATRWRRQTFVFRLPV